MLGDVCVDRPRRGRHKHDPGRQRWRHLGQPRAFGGGRAAWEHSKRCFPDESIWAWDELPEPTRRRGREMGDPHLHDSDALQALVFVLRLALDRSSGSPTPARILGLPVHRVQERGQQHPDSHCPAVIAAPTGLHHSRCSRSRPTVFPAQPRSNKSIMRLNDPVKEIQVKT
jgi:hypothetical protein